MEGTKGARPANFLHVAATFFFLRMSGLRSLARPTAMIDASIESDRDVYSSALNKDPKHFASFRIRFWRKSRQYEPLTLKLPSKRSNCTITATSASAPNLCGGAVPDLPYYCIPV